MSFCHNVTCAVTGLTIEEPAVASCGHLVDQNLVSTGSFCRLDKKSIVRVYSFEEIDADIACAGKTEKVVCAVSGLPLQQYFILSCGHLISQSSSGKHIFCAQKGEMVSWEMTKEGFFGSRNQIAGTAEFMRRVRDDKAFSI